MNNCNSITHLICANSCNCCEISSISFPPYLTHLSFGDSFNQNVDSLPPQLIYLKFGNNFNQAIDHLPPHLLHLILGTKFDQTVDNLPSSLTHLEISGIFNNLIDNLPNSLIYLSIKGYYCFPVQKLPPSLQNLTLPYSIPISHIPPSVTHFSLSFSNPVFNGIPPNITHLTLINKIADNLNKHVLRISAFPSTVTHLTLGGVMLSDNLSLFNLPKLTHLNMTNISWSKNDNCINFHNIWLDKLSPNITHLIFPNNFNYPVNNLPPSLTHITFGTFFNNSVAHLPKSLTYLVFGYSFDKNVDFLPPNLTHLKFGRMCSNTAEKEGKAWVPTYSSSSWTSHSQFNHPINHLPPRLTHLSFSFVSQFNHPVSRLPKTLTHLTLGGRRFNQIVHQLPTSITHLTLSTSFRHPLPYHLTNLVALKFYSSLHFPSYPPPSSLLHFHCLGSIAGKLSWLPRNLKTLIISADHLIASSGYIPCHLSLLVILGEVDVKMIERLKARRVASEYVYTTKGTKSSKCGSNQSQYKHIDIGLEF